MEQFHCSCHLDKFRLANARTFTPCSGSAILQTCMRGVNSVIEISIATYLECGYEFHCFSHLLRCQVGQHCHLVLIQMRPLLQPARSQQTHNTISMGLTWQQCCFELVQMRALLQPAPCHGHTRRYHNHYCSRIAGLRHGIAGRACCMG